MTRKAVLDDPMGQKAALVLLRAYKRQRGEKSWARVAARYGLTKSRAYDIANGRRKASRQKEPALYRAVLRESECVRAPKKFLRFIRRVAVPFLAKRQRSRHGLYARGGVPL